MKSSQYLLDPRMDANSHSTSTIQKSSLLNGLIPSHRLSETLSSIPSFTPTSRVLINSKNPIKTSKKIENIFLILSLTLILLFLLITTIEFSTILVQKNQEENISSILNDLMNQTKFEKSHPINSFFACVFIFNLLLFIICLSIHLLIYQRTSQHIRAKAAFFREFGRIFDNGKCSSTNPLVDYVIKSCLLCVLWYLSCYLMFRSMSILISSEIIILYSITITLRQVLGWIFLHEQFIGNKIIAHILALSALLFLAHHDGFRFNRFLLGLTMVTCSVIMKATFDILIHGFVKDLTSSKLRIVMINVCFCGTCLLWPFALIFHVTNIEPIESIHFYSFIFLITLICALAFNVLTIVIPIQYTSTSHVASLLLAIPSISLIDRYYFNIKYSPLVISAILCSFIGVLLSMIPTQWFQPGEAARMKQALGLSSKDLNGNTTTGAVGSGGTTTGTSSAFDEIRAQRRLRNALLYNEIKT